MDVRAKIFVTMPSHQQAKLRSIGVPTILPRLANRLETAMYTIIRIRPRAEDLKNANAMRMLMLAAAEIADIIVMM
jgi:hypothetical protein